MTKKAMRTAAVLAALTILVGLTPVASEAAPARSDRATVGAERPAPDGLWASLAGLWQELVSAVFANSEEEGGENGASGAPPGGGGASDENTNGNEGDEGPSGDPNG